MFWQRAFGMIPRGYRERRLVEKLTGEREKFDRACEERKGVEISEREVELLISQNKPKEIDIVGIIESIARNTEASVLDICFPSGTRLSGFLDLTSLSSKYIIRTIRTPNVNNVKVASELIVSNRSISRIFLGYSNLSIILRSCAVFELDISGSRANVRVENCRIDHLKIGVEAIGRLSMTDCFVRSFTCVAPSDKPISGDADIRNLTIYTRDGDKSAVQSLRNMRAALSNLGNELAAGYFHSAELTLERPREPFFSRIFSYIYGGMADFGNSIGRPFAWFALFLAALAFIGATPGAVVAIAPDGGSDALKGWHQHLDDGDLLGRISRSLVFAFSTIFNPLGVFGVKQLVIATHPGIAFLAQLVGLFGMLSVFFLIVALRRRFRLGGG